MSKGLLEAFHDLRDYNACNHCQYQKTKDCIKDGFCIWNDIEKELEALNIIKHCFKDFIEFDEIELPHIDKKHYEIKIFNETIYVSKEKYDLLKEVLL